MKVSQLVKICAEMLQLDLDEGILDGAEAQAMQDRDIKTLVNACNFVLEELYRDYATSLRKTVIRVTDGFADTSSFKMCKVISLVDAEGNDVPFRYCDNGLYVQKDGCYNLSYARLACTLGWNDDIAMPSPRITERILAYGVLREYYAVTGDWHNAAQWDERFKNALQVSRTKVSAMRMPARRWV